MKRLTFELCYNVAHAAQHDHQPILVRTVDSVVVVLAVMMVVQLAWNLV